MTNALVVITTVENRQDGESLALLLVENRLAACVQILAPMTSIYHWNGNIETSDEVLLLIKTTKSAYPALETKILENHPYQTPEIIALPVTAGFKGYLDWLTDSI